MESIDEIQSNNLSN